MYELDILYDESSMTMTWKINYEVFFTNQQSTMNLWSCEFILSLMRTTTLYDEYQINLRHVEMVYDTKKFNANEMQTFCKCLRDNQSGMFAIINYDFEIKYDHMLELLSIIQRDNYISTVLIPLNYESRQQFANQFDRVIVIIDSIIDDHPLSGVLMDA